MSHSIFNFSEYIQFLVIFPIAIANNFSLYTSLSDEEQNPLPLHIEQFLLPSDILCTFPRVGTVLRVMTDKTHEKFGLNFNGIGKWVRFRNMTCEVHFGSWKGLLTSSSRVRYLPENHDTVLECIR